ncbi:hypothetical protein Tco_1554312 [Tanacetum coccineum]
MPKFYNTKEGALNKSKTSEPPHIPHENQYMVVLISTTKQLANSEEVGKATHPISFLWNLQPLHLFLLIGYWINGKRRICFIFQKEGSPGFLYTSLTSKSSSCWCVAEMKAAMTMAPEYSK